MTWNGWYGLDITTPWNGIAPMLPLDENDEDDDDTTATVMAAACHWCYGSMTLHNVMVVFRPFFFFGFGYLYTSNEGKEYLRVCGIRQFFLFFFFYFSTFSFCLLAFSHTMWLMTYMYLSGTWNYFTSSLCVCMCGVHTHTMHVLENILSKYVFSPMPFSIKLKTL